MVRIAFVSSVDDNKDGGKRGRKNICASAKFSACAEAIRAARDPVVDRTHTHPFSQYFNLYLLFGKPVNIIVMSTMFADTILIVFISVCTALLAEGG